MKGALILTEGKWEAFWPEVGEGAAAGIPSCCCAERLATLHLPLGPLSALSAVSVLGAWPHRFLQTGRLPSGFGSDATDKKQVRGQGDRGEDIHSRALSARAWWLTQGQRAGGPFGEICAVRLPARTRPRGLPAGPGGEWSVARGLFSAWPYFERFIHIVLYINNCFIFIAVYCSVVWIYGYLSIYFWWKFGLDLAFGHRNWHLLRHTCMFSIVRIHRIYLVEELLGNVAYIPSTSGNNDKYFLNLLPWYMLALKSLPDLCSSLWNRVANLRYCQSFKF